MNWNEGIKYDSNYYLKPKERILQGDIYFRTKYIYLKEIYIALYKDIFSVYYKF
jgi:hypothetical protein